MLLLKVDAKSALPEKKCPAVRVQKGYALNIQSSSCYSTPGSEYGSLTQAAHHPSHWQAKDYTLPPSGSQSLITLPVPASGPAYAATVLLLCGYPPMLPSH